MRGSEREFRWWLSALLLLVGLLSCSPAAPTATTQPAAAPQTSNAASAPSASAPALGAQPAATVPAGPPEQLRVAWVSVGGGFLPLHAAQQKGFFEKHGVNVDLVFTTGPQAVQSLLAREVDVAYVDAAQLVRAGLAGADTVMLAATTNTLLFKLIALPSIQRPEDLKGKRLGITRLGTTSDFAARYMLERVGLAPDSDVALVQTGGSPELFQALAAGAIDAGLANEPFVMQARKQGYSVPYDFVSLGLEMPQNAIGTLHGVVAQRPEAFRRFLAGLVEAIAWTKQNRAEALQVLARYTQTEDPEILNATYDEHAPRYPPVPHVTEAGVQTVFDSLRDSEPRVAELQATQFIDDRFLRELEDSGFVRQLYP